MQIRRNAAGRIEFIATVGVQMPVAFALASLSETEAQFENPTPDFPQRVAYALKQGRLKARIEEKSTSARVNWANSPSSLSELSFESVSTSTPWVASSLFLSPNEREPQQRSTQVACIAGPFHLDQVVAVRTGPASVLPLLYVN